MSIQFLSKKRHFYWFWYIILAIIVFRLVICFFPPSATTDLLRNIGFGKEFWKYGLHIYDFKAEDFYPKDYSYLWPEQNYDYPVFSIIFFAIIAKIWPSILFGKIILTILEIINSFLLFKITRSKLFTILYVINPISIWWISHEGQFEPLLIFFTLIALYFLKNNKVNLSYLFLSIAIQTKIFPIILLPYFVLKKKIKLQNIIYFIAGFLPSIIFILNVEYIPSISSWNFYTFPMVNYSINLGDLILHFEFIKNIIPNFSTDYLLSQLFINIILLFMVLLCFIYLFRNKKLEYLLLIFFLLIPLFLPKYVPWYLVFLPIFLTLIPNKKRTYFMILFIILGLPYLLDLFTNGFFSGHIELFYNIRNFLYVN